MDKRAKYLHKTYGISEETYAKMLVSNQGRCHICDRSPKPGKNLCVDHDHVSLEIRGLLCFLCNKRLIGRKRREHSQLFSRAAAYLWRVPGWGFAPVQAGKKRKK